MSLFGATWRLGVLGFAAYGFCFAPIYGQTALERVRGWLGRETSADTLQAALDAARRGAETLGQVATEAARDAADAVEGAPAASEGAAAGQGPRRSTGGVEQTMDETEAPSIAPAGGDRAPHGARDAGATEGTPARSADSRDDAPAEEAQRSVTPDAVSRGAEPVPGAPLRHDARAEADEPGNRDGAQAR